LIIFCATCCTLLKLQKPCQGLIIVNKAVTVLEVGGDDVGDDAYLVVVDFDGQGELFFIVEVGFEIEVEAIDFKNTLAAFVHNAIGDLYLDCVEAVCIGNQL